MKRPDRNHFQQWPEPLPAAKQVELAREMAHLRSRVRYMRLWKLAACRTQDLLAWKRYDDLMRSAQRQYERVRNVLWETNMSLVCWVAQRCGHDILTLDELVEVGTIKLMTALDCYDPYRGFQVSTYLTVALQREFWRAIKAEQRRRDRQTLVYDERDWDGLVGYYVAEEADWPASHAELQDAIETLDDRERDIVLARASTERATLGEAGRRHGVSKERARQVEMGALTKMARHLGAEEVCCGLGRV